MADYVEMAIDDEWRARLAEAVKKSGKSKNAISLAAKLGHGYVHSLLGKEQKDPTIQNLAKVCDQIDVTMHFILYGYEITPQAEEWLRHFQSASPETRASILQLSKPPSES